MKIAYFGSYLGFRYWITRFAVESYNDAMQLATLTDGSTIKRVANSETLAGLQIDCVIIDNPAQIDIIKQLMQWPKLKTPLQSST